MASYIKHVTMDCRDAKAQAEFWAAALELDIHDGASEAFAVVGGPDRPTGHPLLMFQQVPENKTVKNRVHLDLETAGDTITEAARLIDLGARKIADMDQWGFQWTIMADPEGNEFCLAPPHG